MFIISRKIEGRILGIEPECYLKIGFEGADGKSGVKMLKIDTLIDFLGFADMYSEECYEITETHQKVGNIEMLDRCLIKKNKKELLDKWT